MAPPPTSDPRSADVFRRIKHFLKGGVQVTGQKQEATAGVLTLRGMCQPLEETPRVESELAKMTYFAARVLRQTGYAGQWVWQRVYSCAQARVCKSGQSLGATFGEHIGAGVRAILSYGLRQR